jgi:hypothetical protein
MLDGRSPRIHVALTPKAGSIPAATEADVSGSEVGARHTETDTAETAGPDDREIGEGAITASMATITHLIGVPSGDPEDPGRSPPRSRAGSEVEPDDRREEMLGAEMPEMDSGRDEPVDLARWHERQRAIPDQEDEQAGGRHRTSARTSSTRRGVR